MEDQEKKEYQLVASYVKQRYFISTAYRHASTTVEMWYFETMIWDWNSETRKRGDLIYSEDSGSYEEIALERHNELIKEFNNKLPIKS